MKIDKKKLRNKIIEINTNLDALVEGYKTASGGKVNLYEFKVKDKNIIETLDANEEQLSKFENFKSNLLNIATLPCKQNGKNVSLFKLFPNEIVTIHHDINNIIEHISFVKQEIIKESVEKNTEEIENLKNELNELNDFNQRVKEKFGSYEAEMSHLWDNIIPELDNRIYNIKKVTEDLATDYDKLKDRVDNIEKTAKKKNNILLTIIFSSILLATVAGGLGGVKIYEKFKEQDKKIENIIKEKIQIDRTLTEQSKMIYNLQKQVNTNSNDITELKKIAENIQLQIQNINQEIIQNQNFIIDLYQLLNEINNRISELEKTPKVVPPSPKTEKPPKETENVVPPQAVKPPKRDNFEIGIKNLGAIGFPSDNKGEFTTDPKQAAASLRALSNRIKNKN